MLIPCPHCLHTYAQNIIGSPLHVKCFLLLRTTEHSHAGLDSLIAIDLARVECGLKISQEAQ